MTTVRYIALCLIVVLAGCAVPPYNERENDSRSGGTPTLSGISLTLVFFAPAIDKPAGPKRAVSDADLTRVVDGRCNECKLTKSEHLATCSHRDLDAPGYIAPSNDVATPDPSGKVTPAGDAMPAVETKPSDDTRRPLVRPLAISGSRSRLGQSLPKVDVQVDPLGQVQFTYRDGDYSRNASVDTLWVSGALLIAAIAFSGLLIWAMLKVPPVIKRFGAWTGNGLRRVGRYISEFVTESIEFGCDLMLAGWYVLCWVGNLIARPFRRNQTPVVEGPAVESTRTVEVRHARTTAVQSMPTFRSQVTLEQAARAWSVAFGDAPTETRVMPPVNLN